MQLIRDFNPRIPFTISKYIPPSWQTHLTRNSNHRFYVSDGCNILFQEIITSHRTVWLLTIRAFEDHILLKLKLPEYLYQLLLYSIRNDNEMLVFHSDMACDLTEEDYTYEGPAFTDKDLRIMLAEGHYELMLISLSEDDLITAENLRPREEILTFIAASLKETGLSHRRNY